MFLTAEQANELLDSVHTKEQLLDLIDRVDHRVDGPVTVLYSGFTGEFHSEGIRRLHSGAIAEALHRSGNNIRTIDQSEAGKFLNQTEGTQFYNEKLKRKFEEIFRNNPDELRSFMDGERTGNSRINNGVWDRLSAKYAADAVGEVVTLTGSAVDNRVFFQTELPIILDNPNVTSIDGIPVEAFRGMTLEEAFSVIVAASDERASKLSIAVDAAGNPMMVDRHYILDARNFFEDSKAIDGKAPPPDTPMRSMADFIPQERVAAHREALKEIRRAQDNLALHYKQDLLNHAPQTPSRWLTALDQLGHIADVVSLAAVAYDAKVAMDAGDQEAAEEMLTRWALENAGAILAGRLASLAVTPLLAAGPLGWLAAGGLVLSASMLGGAYGDDVAEFMAGHLAGLWDRALGGLRDQFQAAERPYSCPLVLDLDRNGVTTLPENTAGIYFDHDRNGFAERTGWVSPTDGLLVRDLNGNGLIDDGSELFGNHTDLPDGSRAANGFIALGKLDANGDQYLDHLDPAWSTLKIWMDTNSSGSVDGGELLSMDEVGVLRLGVSYSASTFADSHGNQHLQTGEYVAQDGTKQAMNDVWFRVDEARTRWLHSVPEEDSVIGLPNLRGMGRVMDLHQAMALDSSGTLRLLLERWMQGSATQREALIDPLIFQWTGVASPGEDPGYSSLDGRLAVMERLLDRTYRQGWLDPQPVGVPATMLHRAYEDFRLQLEDQLILQTDARPLLGHFLASDGSLLAEMPTQALEKVADYLAAFILANPDVVSLFRLSGALRSLGDDGKEMLSRVQEYGLTEGSLDSLYLRLFSEHRLYKGTSESNQLHGSVGEDLI
ncbi:hypothetical protein VB738_16340, partial [Cyanobium gracile UHCC 0139]|nr:hypothetical protein [Cyanobium gracile UHCC 0139]